MSITVDGLRKSYPVIDEEHYSSTRVRYWLAEAQLDLRPCVWGARWERGVYAYAAHKLIMEKTALDANDDGLGGMEANRGSITGESDSVDGVSHSVSYASPASSGSSSAKVEMPWEKTIPGQDYLEMSAKVSIARGASYVG